VRAALLVQTAFRRYLQKRIFQWAWKSVVSLQTLHRSRGVRSLYERIMTYVKLLKQGAIFLKYAKNTPPHDRFVWLSDDLKTLNWCHPDWAGSDELERALSMSDDEMEGSSSKKRGAAARPLYQSIPLVDCIEVAEGATTKTFLKSSYKRGRTLTGSENMLQLKVLPQIKKDIDQILHPTDSFSRVHNANVPIDERSCLSLVTEQRTLDLVAHSNRVRDDWMWGLRMLVIHWTSTSDLANVNNQRRMLGIDIEFCARNRYRAVDILGDEYIEVELDIDRPSEGMGVVIDSANNVVLEVEPGGAAARCGLLVGDLVCLVDGTAVTVIDDGYAHPRSVITAAIHPYAAVVKMTVFRRWHAEDPDDGYEYDGQL